MDFAIIGSGISGLATAFYLTRHDDVRVTVYEAADVFGGRANTTDDGEHCARLFLDDYTYLSEILRHIRVPDGRTIHQTLHRVERMCHSRKLGWVATSHLYPLFARELPLRDKLSIATTRRASPLLAAQKLGVNTNRYGSRKNYSLRSVVRVGANLLHSRTAYALEGPTAECFVAPWVDHLDQRGVTLVRSTPVSSLRLHDDGVSVRSDRGAESYDAVVVTAFVPDMIDLLVSSGIEHSVRNLDHTHCKCLTLALDPREAVLSRDRPVLYSHDGISVVVQPGGGRCVVLCTRALSTEDDFLLGRVREYMQLEHDFVDVSVRDNLRPGEALYTADYVHPDKVLRRPRPHIFFAGSYLRNSYPVDSGEGATRTALDATRRMERRYNLQPVLR